MKPAKYDSAPGALAAFLAGKPQGAFLCDLYTFTLAGTLNAGLPLTYATTDTDVTVPYAVPVTYSSRHVYFDQFANKAYGHWKVGLDVDTWQVLCSPAPQALIGGQGFLAALRAGVLDGATVAVDRAIFDNRVGGRTLVGVVNVFTGRVAEIDLGRSNAVISVNSHLELLSVNMPRNLYQAGCRWTLFDAGCTLNAAGFAVSGTIAADAGSTNVISVSVGLPAGSRTYALGRLVMTSGQNSGFSRSIRAWTAGSPASFSLMAPFPFPLAAGDNFDAYPGCDKLENTCLAFNNLSNFGGMPFIPAPETAV
jgi:uncharacterized phage protein (TIGR02218 family)